MVTIRRERQEDIDQIHQVNERAFGGPAEAELVDLLRDRQKVILSLVAEIEARVVGHILFTSVTVESTGEKYPAVGLGPMAVEPNWQAQGVGSALVRAGLDECRRTGHESLEVVGHPKYYPRFGFAPAGRYGITCEYEAPQDTFMVIELREGALHNCPGMAIYPPEFHKV